MPNGKSPINITFTVENLGEELEVRTVAGDESISNLYAFEIDFICRGSEISFDKVVNQKACLTFSDSEPLRYVHGVVHRMRKVDRGTRGIAYVATLMPKVWQLTLGSDCRIFQEKSMKEIVTDVLSKAGIKPKFHCAGGKEPKPREYCVQYRESDWAFISRLLAEEGFCYYFEHKENDHVLHLTNDPTVLPGIPGGDAGPLPFHVMETSHVTTEHIFKLQFLQEVCPSIVTLRDYNFKKPKLDIPSEAKDKNDKIELEIYDYPGEFSAPEEGDILAELQLEQARAARVQGTGQAFCTRFVAGHYFTLSGYHFASPDAKDEYLLLSVHHSAQRPIGLESSKTENFSYSNTFTCIPRSTPFRPVHPGRPMVRGVQTAIVVGPDKSSSEEIHTDEHGRVKVLFHWDRLSREGKQANKKYGSCWIRVSQHWAGPAMGALFTPRVGDEVIVDFLEGDPDRPIITGRVYHGTNRTPCKLPDKKTQSTIKTATSPGGVKAGFNELRFEDKKGSEEIFLHGQKDWNIVIENDQTMKVGNDQSENVEKNKTQEIKGDREETVGGDVKITVRGNQTESIDGNDTLTVKGDQSITVNSSHSQTVDGSSTEQVGEDKSVKVDASYNEKVSDDRSMKVGGSIAISAGGSIAQKAKSNWSVEAKSNALVKASSSIKNNASKIILTGKSSVLIKQGSAQISMKGGKVTIKASEITLQSSGNVVVKGSTISLN